MPNDCPWKDWTCSITRQVLSNVTAHQTMETTAFLRNHSPIFSLRWARVTFPLANAGNAGRIWGEVRRKAFTSTSNTHRVPSQNPTVLLLPHLGLYLSFLSFSYFLFVSLFRVFLVASELCNIASSNVIPIPIPRHKCHTPSWRRNLFCIWHVHY